jgi:WD40 repeat protein
MLLLRDCRPLAACLLLLLGPPARSEPQDEKAKPVPPAAKQVRTDLQGSPLPTGVLARLGSVRFRHADEVSAIAFAPDGRTLASGSHDGALRLWEVPSGKELTWLQLPEKMLSIDALAFSPDGKMLAAASALTIHLREVPTGKPLRQLRVPDSLNFVAFSPDGRTLASAGASSKTIRLWDPATGQEIRQLVGQEDSVTFVTFSRDGKTLASGDFHGRIHLWNVATGREQGQLGSEGLLWISSIAYSPDGRTLAAGSADNAVRLWDTASGKELPPLRGHEGPVTSVAFSPDGKTLASGNWDSTIRWWDLASGKERNCFKGHVGKVRSVAFCPDGQILASVGDNREQVVRLWHLPTGKELHADEAPRKAILAVAFSPGGQMLASGGRDGEVRLWQAATSQEVRRLVGHKEHVRAVAFSHDGKLLASGSFAAIRLWEVPTGKELWRLQGQDNSLASLSFSPGGKLLVAGGGMLRLWEVATGKELRQFSDARFLTFSPDGKVFVTQEEKTIVLRESATGKDLQHWQVEEEYILAAAFSLDGKRLVVGCAWKIYQWEVATGKELHQFPVPEQAFDALVLSPDGRTLILHQARMIRLWEIATGKEIRPLPPSPARVTSLAFSPDGKTLATGSTDTTVLVWDLTGHMQGNRLGPMALTPHELESLWTDLISDKVAEADQALWKLAAAPQQTVPFLHKRLQVVPVVDPKQIAQHIADLGDNRFVVRQRATKTLEQLGELAEPALRQTLQRNPGLEIRRRVEQLLGKMEKPSLSHEQLRTLRALTVLEQIGSPEAQQVLKALASGAAGARLTPEAQAAIERLNRLSAATP